MFGTLFTLLTGVTLGWFFKPQIDHFLTRTARRIEENKKDE
jgi:hypothetical protein